MVLKLESSPELLDLWPRRFRVELGIHLSSSLSLSFKVLNLDQSPIIFQHAFHTYFQIRSIKKVVINGLHEAMYIDQLSNNERKKESKRILTFDGETDRIYTNVPRPVTMLDPVYKRKYVVAKRNMADYVIWNPWEKKNLALPDLSEGAYQNMVCIEAGNIVQSITVEPGGTFEAYMNLSVVSLTSPDPDSKDDWPGLPPS